jgi:DNA-binding response OmpR family regulator
VLRLRKLFEPNPEEPRHFITVRGRGYLFRK